MSASEVGRMNPDEIRQRRERCEEIIGRCQRHLDAPEEDPFPAGVAALEREIAEQRWWLAALLDVLAVRDQEIAQLEKALEEEVANRDRNEEWADALAYAIAPMSVIGEHSSMNHPWSNALEQAAVRDQEIAELKSENQSFRNFLEASRSELAVRDQQLEAARALLIRWLTITIDDAVNGRQTASDTEAFVAGLDVQEAGQ